MRKDDKKPHQSSILKASEGIWSNFLFLSIDEIRTSWSALRMCQTRIKVSDLGDMPIRVVVVDGRYEVIDGFKRLERWKQAGVKKVPVLVESCGAGLAKHLVLEANSPKRTITALDEARVINSLIKDDELTVNAVAKLLNRRKEWVVGRRSLLRLSYLAQKLLETGRINLMVARLLTSLPVEDQDSVLAAIEKHGLKMRESQLLIQTWRSASSEEKPGLLADPFFTRDQPDSPSHSARLKALEVKLSAIRNALDEFSCLTIPVDLAQAEQRRLQAICASIQNQITLLAKSFTTEISDSVQTNSETARTVFKRASFSDELEDFIVDELNPGLVAAQCHSPSFGAMESQL